MRPGYVKAKQDLRPLPGSCLVLKPVFLCGMVTPALSNWTGNLQVHRFSSFTTQKACPATRIKWLDYASAKVHPPQSL
ncbi:hypothetical protein BJX63DRAFT_62924 [Aspergillus granulosus]|uniref:Uncharacterized protein n=1 Tax=Aspergillus granulosus TaxID=176169 RepID=A0ABR4GYM1_9EURO